MTRTLFRTLTVVLVALALSPLVSAAPTFRKGVSIAHWMAKVYRPEGPGAAWFGEADIDWIAAQGFDHIRFPVDGRYLEHDGAVDEQRIAPLLKALEHAREKGLGAVLDMHFLPGGVYDHDHQDPAIFTQAEARQKAAAWWATLARFFQGHGDYLRFELLNEPFAPQDEQLNQLNDELIAAIRKVDTERFLYVTTNQSSTFDTLPSLRVPADAHTGIIVHYDEPEIFTHQRASWKQCPPDMAAVEFPGTVPDFTRQFPAGHFAAAASGRVLSAVEIERAFAKAAAWLQQNAKGREVYLGEFGCYEMAPAASRTRYIRAVRQAAEKSGWGWCVWSYNASFAIRDDNGKPTAVLDGLFKN